MTDNPHLGRWCVVDEIPMDAGGKLIHHIYCSFGDSSSAHAAAADMNSMMRNDPKGTVRRKVVVMHYYFPKDGLDV